ncbi:MAG: carboxypeptidase regulatory-like domain-containing protein, partial [Candidatus Omnitrophica bacterium]|nr:carboxypeptidase regulatory-like domain-containing protein [Candidatus Omnitrophota bacterium]
VGTYFLRADPDSFQFLVERFYLNGNSVATGTPIQITGSGNLTGIDFQVQQGGVLSGVVTEQGSGLPLAGFDLDLFTSAGSFVRFGAVTSATGYYEIGAVPPGSYVVRVDPDPLTGYVRTYYPSVLFQADATPFSVSAGMVTTPIDISVPLGGTITGTITESGTSMPIASVDLDVYDSLGNRLPITAKSDAVGFYRLGGLPVGDYTVRADPIDSLGLVTEFYNGTPFPDQATFVSVTTGMETTNIDFTLDAGGYIEGLVLAQSGGTPLPGIDLDLFSDTGTFISAVDAVSSSTGYYRLGPIAPGNWVVQADSTPAQGYVDQYFNLKTTFPSADLISVSANATTSNIDFSPLSGGTISGTIRAAQNNQPLPDIDLDVFLTDGTPVSIDARSDLTGQFLLGPLPPGQYIIRADPLNASGYIDQYYDGAVTLGAATPVTVTVSQETSGIDFLLGGGTFTVGNWNLYE